MANPRKIVKYNGIRYEAQTFKIDGVTITYDEDEENGSAQANLAVTMSADDTVALTADGNAVVGKLLKVEHDGMCNVQTAGYMALPKGDGAMLTRGSKIVGDLGAAAARGYVRDVATATAAELGVARGMVVNTADTEDVWVRME
jgi:hypothetical protein